MEWAILILDDIVDQGRDTEVSDSQTLTNEELILILALLLELLLANSQEFGQNTVADLLQFCAFFFIGQVLAKQRCECVEYIGPSIDYLVNLTAKCPVVLIVLRIVAELKTIASQEGTQLLHS